MPPETEKFALNLKSESYLKSLKLTTQLHLCKGNDENPATSVSLVQTWVIKTF